jgi:hypothetical protein
MDLKIKVCRTNSCRVVTLPGRFSYGRRWTAPASLRSTLDRARLATVDARLRPLRYGRRRRTRTPHHRPHSPRRGGSTRTGSQPGGRKRGRSPFRYRLSRTRFRSPHSASNPEFRSRRGGTPGRLGCRSSSRRDPGVGPFEERRRAVRKSVRRRRGAPLEAGGSLVFFRNPLRASLEPG